MPPDQMMLSDHVMLTMQAGREALMHTQVMCR